MTKPVLAIIYPDCVMIIHKNPEEFVDHLCENIEKRKTEEVCDGFLIITEDRIRDPEFFFKILSALRGFGLRIQID